MKIYSVTQDDKYKTLVDALPGQGLQDFATGLAYGERSLKEAAVFDVVYNADDSRKKALSDVCTFFRPVIVVSKAVLSGVDSLQKLPRLEVNFPSDQLVALFVNNFVDGFFNSDVSDFDEGEDGLVIYKLVLRKVERLPFDIFRVKESLQTILVSERFKAAVEGGGFKGFLFEEVVCSGL